MAKKNMNRRSLEAKDSPERSRRWRGESLSNEKLNIEYDYQQESTETPLKDQERAIRRHEARDVYPEIYKLSQKRDQRAFARPRDLEGEFFAGLDPRRRQELADGGMVQEDHRAMANLPREEIHHEYPQAGYYFTPFIDASHRGVDQMGDDAGTVKQDMRVK